MHQEVSVKRYILTGMPGCGKTSIIDCLKQRGYATIPEAATDVIAEEQANGKATPWQCPSFIDKIITKQKQRQLDTLAAELQFYDRSPFCTYALAYYLGFSSIETKLTEEISRIQKNNIYRKQVFFIENLGFITNNSARKISFAEALKFEQIHKNTYLQFGYELEMVPVLPVMDRASFILTAQATWL